MLKKTALIFIIIGNIGLLTSILNVKVFYYKNRNFFEFFRGGNLGGIIVGLSFILGYLGIALLLVYLLKKNKSKWYVIFDIIFTATFIIMSSYLAQYV